MKQWRFSWSSDHYSPNLTVYQLWILTKIGGGEARAPPPSEASKNGGGPHAPMPPTDRLCRAETRFGQPISKHRESVNWFTIYSSTLNYYMSDDERNEIIWQQLDEI